jgi:outer membrane immunogenic protein
MGGRFNRAFALAGAVLIAPLASRAADLGPGGYKDGPAPTVSSWGGWYAGVNGGGGYSPDQILAYGPTVFTGLEPGGGFGGGQVGYNWQLPATFHAYGGYGSILLGLEADIQGSGIGDSGYDANYNHYNSELDYFGTVRGRIGYATDRSLYYVTGGLAYGGVKQSVSFVQGPAYSVDTTATGYVFGGGIELKTSRAWSVKFEYQYIDLGTNAPVSGSGSYYTAGGKTEENTYSTFRIGINYHPVLGYEPLK